MKYLVVTPLVATNQKGIVPMLTKFRTIAPLLGAAFVLAGLAPGAVAAPDNRCGPSWDSRKTDITGTGKAEKFHLNETKRVINAHGGNDVIEARLPEFRRGLPRFPATVCMGSGDDILRATDAAPRRVPVRYLDGGAGYDKAEIYICFEGDAGPKWTLRNVEEITVINCLD